MSAAGEGRPLFREDDPRGWVEDSFAKLVSPAGERALWVKLTVLLGPRRDPRDGAPRDRTALAESWAIAFERGAPPIAVKSAVPLASARFVRSSFGGQADRLRIGENGLAGAVASGGRTIAFDVELEAKAPPWRLLPFSWLYDRRVPVTKIVSPVPDAVARGSFSVNGTRFGVDGWRAMLGHNAGRRHTRSYAWAHANAWDDAGGSSLVFEGFSARPLRFGPALTALFVSFEGERFSWSQPRDIALSNEARVTGSVFSFSGRNAAADVEGAFTQTAPETAALLYANPHGAPTYCHNSKLACGWIRFRARPMSSAVSRSTRGAALEIAGPSLHPGMALLA